MEELVFEPLYVQRDSAGRFRVNIPKREVAEMLGLANKQRVRALIDVERRRFIFEIVDERKL